MSRPAFAAALVTCLLTAATPTSAQNAERYLDQFLDRAVSPREDFFHYSVGKWLREHPIPKSERSWGVSDVIQGRRPVGDLDQVIADGRAKGGDKIRAEFQDALATSK